MVGLVSESKVQISLSVSNLYDIFLIQCKTEKCWCLLEEEKKLQSTAIREKNSHNMPLQTAGKTHSIFPLNGNNLVQSKAATRP